VAYTYQQILESEYQSLAEEHAQALADLEAGRISEDPLRTTSASRRILELDGTRERLDRRANQFIASQQGQPQASKYGLNKDEIEVAHTIASGARDLTNEERERIYAEQKSKLARMRATREYDDTQGRVFK
jgi:hypothetical protein